MKTKQCSKCHEIKPTTEFYTNKASKDGLLSNCKKCHLEYKRHYLANEERPFRKYQRRNVPDHIMDDCKKIMKRCS